MVQSKLPIWRTIFDAYRILFRNFGTYLRLSWLPFLVVIAGTAAARVFSRDVAGDAADPEFSYVEASEGFVEVIIWFVTIPLATAWTRLILLQNADSKSRISLRVGREEIVYLGRYVVLLILFLGIVVVPVGILIALVPVQESGEFADAFYALIFLVYLPGAFIAAIPIYVPLLLILPAAAVGRSSSFCASRRLSKGNVLRIGSIFVIALAPEIFEAFFTGFEEEASTLSDDETWIDVLLMVLQEYIVSWLFFTISVASLALIYQRLAGDSDDEINTPAVAP